VPRARINLPVRQRKERLDREGLCDLLDRVWGLDINSNVLQPAAYLQHYRRMHNMLDGSIISIPDLQTLIDILNAIKMDRHLPLHQIKEDLKSTGSRWIVARDSEQAASKAIEFSVQLWLMVQPGPEIHLDSHLTLEEIVAQSFENPSTAPPLTMNTSQHERLSPDFGAKNLIRIGGIEIIWTSFLSEHLLFVGRHQLKVFGHVSILRKYARSTERWVTFLS
jgi:hypothetical protein